MFGYYVTLLEIRCDPMNGAVGAFFNTTVEKSLIIPHAVAFCIILIDILRKNQGLSPESLGLLKRTWGRLAILLLTCRNCFATNGVYWGRIKQMVNTNWQIGCIWISGHPIVLLSREK